MDVCPVIMYLNGKHMLMILIALPHLTSLLEC